MVPVDPTLRQVVDELANALQAIVLITDHLKLASSATAQDTVALSRSLQRVTAALLKLPTAAGGQ